MGGGEAAFVAVTIRPEYQAGEKEQPQAVEQVHGQIGNFIGEGVEGAEIIIDGKARHAQGAAGDAAGPGEGRALQGRRVQVFDGQGVIVTNIVQVIEDKPAAQAGEIDPRGGDKRQYQGRGDV